MYHRCFSYAVAASSAALNAAFEQNSLNGCEVMPIQDFIPQSSSGRGITDQLHPIKPFYTGTPHFRLQPQGV